MVNPETVTYKGITDLIVLFTNDSYSIAVFKWKGGVKYGIRGNGNESEDDKGTPVSHGIPTWFILPNEAVDNFIRINTKGERK